VLCLSAIILDYRLLTAGRCGCSAVLQLLLNTGTQVTYFELLELERSPELLEHSPLRPAGWWSALRAAGRWLLVLVPKSLSKFCSDEGEVLE
jgi:hypothetical protein